MAWADFGSPSRKQGRNHDKRARPIQEHVERNKLAHRCRTRPACDPTLQTTAPATHPTPRFTTQCCRWLHVERRRQRWRAGEGAAPCHRRRSPACKPVGHDRGNSRCDRGNRERAASRSPTTSSPHLLACSTTRNRAANALTAPSRRPPPLRAMLTSGHSCPANGCRAIWLEPKLVQRKADLAVKVRIVLGVATVRLSNETIIALDRFGIATHTPSRETSRVRSP